MKKLIICLTVLGLFVLSSPAYAAYSGSFSQNEYDLAYGGLTRDNVENGVCDCTGVVQSNDVWPGTNDPRRIVRYYVYYNGSVHTGDAWGAYMYYRQYTSGGPWKLCGKELIDGFAGPHYADLSMC